MWFVIFVFLMYHFWFYQNTFGSDFDPHFQHQYAIAVLDLERINQQLNTYLVGVQQFSQEVQYQFKPLPACDIYINIKKYFTYSFTLNLVFSEKFKSNEYKSYGSTTAINVFTFKHCQDRL